MLGIKFLRCGVFAILAKFDSQLWILYHRELRNQSRISAVVERLHTILSETSCSIRGAAGFDARIIGPARIRSRGSQLTKSLENQLGPISSNLQSGISQLRIFECVSLSIMLFCLSLRLQRKAELTPRNEIRFCGEVKYEVLEVDDANFSHAGHVHSQHGSKHCLC